ncbi:hypothetical protein QBC46DRAFT_412925 [Diplogelasinospora grovesii]|uniref:Uncharacterized protein n=1 Tax=Diplogelasinospora grovesii TaxID=303347 RepID=A0AAN6N137_9PEZI|nr:hypothetical protein QBC46DRAFT_412925 [Diplogelasinospora grovesii]
MSKPTEATLPGHLGSLTADEEQKLQEAWIHLLRLSGVEESASHNIPDWTPELHQLGGLPLAIAIVGAALRQDGGPLNISCQAYLGWADEVKDIILEQDPMFSCSPSSVWKASTFAFEGALRGNGVRRYTAPVAHFIASCENAVEHRRIRSPVPAARAQPLAVPNHPVVVQLRFLEHPMFDLAIRALAGVNMIIVNRMQDQPNNVPYIEMHSLVRRWLIRTGHDEVFTFASSKMWLFGFATYDCLNTCRVRASKFEPLFREAAKELTRNPGMLANCHIPASEVVSPVLLNAHTELSRSTAFLPVRLAQRSPLHQLATELESEIRDSYEQLENDDWSPAFECWAQQLGEEVESAVGCRHDAEKDDYAPKDFFLNTLDSYGYIPIAFEMVVSSKLLDVGHTDTIGRIGAEITLRTRSLLTAQLDREAFEQLPALLPEDASAFARTWSGRWEKDLVEILRSCLADVFIGVQSSAANTEHLATQLPPPPDNAEAESDQSFGGHLQAITDSSDPRNAFFAVLRRAVKAAAVQFLDSCPAAEQLSEQSDAFRDICERSIRNGLGHRAASAFHAQPLSAMAETDTSFSMLWDLAWLGRFQRSLGSFFAETTFNAISDDFKDAAKQGLIDTLNGYMHDSHSFVQGLANEIFGTPSVSNIFPNWILSGWIDPPDCRKAVHDEVMERLNRSKLTDRTGMGPLFAKIPLGVNNTTF